MVYKTCLNSFNTGDSNGIVATWQVNSFLR
jgi:hypothetical protein